jgi:hypothetical protein
MTSKHMVFIHIPKGKFPKTRHQLAKDSGNKELLNMNLPVYYADHDSKIVFTNAGKADAYAWFKDKIAMFAEAGSK